MCVGVVDRVGLCECMYVGVCVRVRVGVRMCMRACTCECA